MKCPSIRCFHRSVGQVRLAQLFRPSILLFLMVLAAVPTAMMAQVTAPDFSIVLFPDTQNESQYYPQVLNTQTQWVVNNRANLNIQAVLGLGDIVNDGASTTQQQNADSAIKLLDNAAVPYLLAIGNHDYDGANTGAATRTATGFNQWWGPSRYAGKPYYMGSYPSGSNENFYGVLTINGKQYLFLVLEYYPRQASLDWAAAVLQANPDKETIVVTHSNMYVDGTRVDVCDSADMDWSTNFVGDVVWGKLISKYANIIMVVNGHFTSGLASRRADLGMNGNLVNQMFSNYQNQPNGGDGWLRLLTFHPGSNTIDVKTYSPYLQTYLTDSANQFTIYWHDPGVHTGSGKITGRVRTTGCQILSGATVTAGTASTTTDANGNFSLSVAAPASYAVNVSAKSEQAATRTVTVNDNYSTDSDFYLAAGSTPPCTLSTVNRTVTICTPANNATVASPVHVVAGTTDTTAPVIRMELWVDGVKQYSVAGNVLDTYVSLASGTRRIVVVGDESDTSYFKTTEYITVGSTGTSAPTVQLSANPATISAGQNSTLSWTSTNATSVTISGVSGTFGPSGTTTVSPSATTTYTATATGSGGTATSSTTVIVSSTTSAPTVQLSANPTNISAGQSSTLNWSSTNASSVTISGVSGTFGPSGTTTVTPSATTTYTATATGSGGTATSSTTVTVQSTSSGCTLSTVNRTVTICTPAPNAAVISPVHVVAGVTDTTAPIIRMEIWVDGVKVYTVAANHIDTNVTMSIGTRRLVVVAAESDTSYFKATEYITVQ